MSISENRVYIKRNTYTCVTVNIWHGVLLIDIRVRIVNVYPGSGIHTDISDIRICMQQ